MLVTRLYGDESKTIDLEINLFSDKYITTLHGVNTKSTIKESKHLIFKKDNRLKPDQMELYLLRIKKWMTKKGYKNTKFKIMKKFIKRKGDLAAKRLL